MQTAMITRFKYRFKTRSPKKEDDWVNKEQIKTPGFKSAEKQFQALKAQIEISGQLQES